MGLIGIFTFSSPGIINHWKIFTISIFGCIRNYLLTVIVHPVTICAKISSQCRHCSCRDSIRRIWNYYWHLLCGTIHYYAKLYSFVVHCIIMNKLFIFWFFPLLYAYIYGFCMSLKKQALREAMGRPKAKYSKSLSNSQPTKY